METGAGVAIAMTPREELFQKYLRALKRSSSALLAVERLRGELSKDCQHEHIRRMKRQRDDGYGRWWTVEVGQCLLCPMEQTSDGRWYKPEYD